MVLLILSGLSTIGCLPLGLSNESRGLLSNERFGDSAFRAKGMSLELVEVLLLERIWGSKGRLLSSVKDR